jgi:hypothetical protein
MTDQEIVDDPLADDIVDAGDIAETDEDDDPETKEGDEVEYDLGAGTGGGA